MNQFTKVGLHRQICESMNAVYKAKNKDYGDSFGESYQEWGAVSAVVRMDDKMRRIKQLVKGNDPQVTEESLIDSVLDLANYSVMFLIELRNEKFVREGKANE